MLLYTNMWKKRDSHLLDVYKNQKSKDDFLLPVATISDDNDSNHNPTTIYSCANMSQSHPSLLFTNATNESTEAKRKDPTTIYQGSDFDVFGKEQLEEHFAPLYSIEQFTPTKSRRERYVKGEILLRTEQEFKRGQIEAMIHDTANLKRRKTSGSSSTAAKEDVAVINGVFIKSTAAINTPAASIFLADKDNSHNEDDDLAYY